MPQHVLVAHLAVMVTPLAGVLGLVYALGPRSRAGMRVPLLVSALAGLVLALWAGHAGHELWNQLKQAAETAGTTLSPLVAAHAHGSDALTTSIFCLAAVALVTVFWVLKPGRAGAGTTIAAWLLGISAAATVVTTLTVTIAAIHAVWATRALVLR